MATFRIVTRKKRADGFMPVYIRVTHNRVSRFVRTGKAVLPSSVTKSGEVTDSFVVKDCMDKIVVWQERLNRVDSMHWDVQQVVDYVTKPDDDICFSKYARQHIFRMLGNGQTRNAKTYQLALNHMERFFGTTKVMFSQLTTINIGKWIESLGKTARAKEQYPVCMRQIFKAACMELNDYDTGIMRIRVNPWIKTKIPAADTPQKRAITAEECRAFFSAPLPESKFKSPLPELGRDVALLCLCLGGINTIDLYELKKKDFYGGVLHYRRAKTMRSRTDGAYFEMRVPEVVLPLLDKYRSDDEYLFNFHARHTTSDSFGANTNAGIRKICGSMGIPKEHWYCVYTFRHTWATTAQNDCGATLQEVGFAMNHSQRGVAITRGYVKMDYTPAWELNEKVIDFILFSDHTSKQAAEHEEKPTMFRVSPKMMIRAAAFYQGHLVASFDDLGMSNVDEVVDRLADALPSDIPNRAIVQFKLVNMDNGKVAVYEHQKGKGF